MPFVLSPTRCGRGSGARNVRSIAMRARLDLLRLTVTAIVITVACLVAGAFFALQHHRTVIARGDADPFAERLVYMAIASFGWALLTPVVFYIADVFPLRKPHRLRNAFVMAVSAVLVALARAGVDGLLPVMIDNLPMLASDYQLSVVALFYPHFLFTLIVIGVANFLRLEREESSRRHADARLESELVEARLRQLRADLHPHFLFNALNAVAALLHRDPASAKEMLVKLRELLGASLASEDAREVRLAEELEFLARYLDIQKMRFGEKLTTAIHLSEPELRNAAIPPLLLQPLVENSIIHGIGRRRDGGSVVVRVESESNGTGDWLCLQVRDNGPGCDPAAVLSRNSVGVPNAVARLASIYGEHQSLKYARRGDAFIAEVRIPLRMLV
jgi:two-component system, LytTR family, sensor kinase